MGPAWHDNPDIARRIAWPTPYPGGPAAVAGATVGKRQRIGEFRDEAATALYQLDAEVQAGLAAVNGKVEANADDSSCGPKQHQHQQQQHLHAVDASDLCVLKIPRHRSSGTLVVVPSTDDSAIAASRVQQAAAAAAAPDTYVLPVNCLQLASWKEAAAAHGALPFGAATAGRRYRPKRVDAAAATTAADGLGADGTNSDKVLQPGSDVVVTFVIYEAGRAGEKVVMQEIQALASNSLSELRDAISCPTDKLAAGLKSDNPAAYFFFGSAFYDDTRAAAASECSQPVRQWAEKIGLTRPKCLYHPRDEDSAQEQQQQQQQGMQQHHTQQQQQQQQACGQSEMPVPQQQQSPAPPQLGEQQQHEAPATCSDSPPAVAAAMKATAAAGKARLPAGIMQDTLLADLELQVSNRPMAVYSHQGCCEHAIMISDIRLAHPADAAVHCNAFPRTLAKAPVPRRFSCTICRKQGAGVLLVNHPHTPEEVATLCDMCEGLFNTAGVSGCQKVVLAD